MIRKCLVLFLAILFPTTTIAQTGAATRATREAVQGEKTEIGERSVNEAPIDPLVLPGSLEGPIDPETYVLGPSDELLLVLRGPETKLHFMIVLPEGNVIVPNVGAVRASGLTLNDFRARLSESLRPFYRNIAIECQLSRPRRFVVFVLGEVRSPRAVELFAPFRLSYAVSAAGGIAKAGSRRQIEIREGDEVIRKVDLFAFLQLGRFEENPILREGQSVYVPARQRRVNVVGEVRMPGPYELIEGETAEDLIAYCGGLTAIGDPERIVLERTDAGYPQPLKTFSMAEAGAIELHDTDVIIVRDVTSFNGLTDVEVFGGGGRTGPVRIATTEPLRDFLGRLWRFDSKFNTGAAVMERKVEGEKPTYIPFSVRDILDGDPVGDTLVHPGDVIAFPRRDELVFVTGEVRTPGEVPFQSGYRTYRYIALAGGPTSAGSFDRLSIISLEGEERKADRESAVYRGETIVVKRRKSKLFGSVFVALTSLTGVLLSVVAITQK